MSGGVADSILILTVTLEGICSYPKVHVVRQDEEQDDILRQLVRFDWAIFGRLWDVRFQADLECSRGKQQRLSRGDWWRVSHKSKSQ